MESTPRQARTAAGLQLQEIRTENEFPDWLGLDEVAAFLHENLKPYEDTVSDIHHALRYALSENEAAGGFILAATYDHQIIGAVVILNTGMTGYIPEHVLVFVSVRPDQRGQGIGGRLVREAVARCAGDVKLHVEYDNPAKRLYERLGFASKYAEMRYTRRSKR